MGYLDGVSSSVQTQLDAKQAAGAASSGQITYGGNALYTVSNYNSSIRQGSVSFVGGGNQWDHVTASYSGTKYLDLFFDHTGIQWGSVTNGGWTNSARILSYNGSTWYIGTGIITTSAGPFSDDRCKFNERVVTSDDCANLVAQLAPRHYNKVDRILTAEQELMFEAGENPFLNVTPKVADPTEEYGFIAQDVEAIAGLEFAVTDNDPGNPKKLQYNSLLTLAIGAIQQLQARVAALESQ